MILAMTGAKYGVLNEHKKELVWILGIRLGGQHTCKDAQRLERQRKVGKRPKTLPNPCKWS